MNGPYHELRTYMTIYNLQIVIYASESRRQACVCYIHETTFIT